MQEATFLILTAGLVLLLCAPAIRSKREEVFVEEES